ncbi:MAG: Crp/Fnr family transcriptional regulator [Chloroflexota bacterium]|nr:Crp/Fnr family transcriptional regulator [Chloroflexota bacterium]
MNELSVNLASNPVFSKLTPRDRNDLAKLAVSKTYQKGEFICWQGEVWPKVLYLESGRLEWSMLSPDGKRQVVFRLEPHNTVWGHSLFDDHPMPASLEVMESAKVYIWTRATIKPIVSHNVEAVWEVSREMVAIMRKVRDIIYGFAFHPVAGRLARLLLDYYQPEEGELAPRDLTLDDMADSIGSTRELVSKTLHRFADAGMIEISRVQFVFTDRNKLEELSGTNQ